MRTRHPYTDELAAYCAAQWASGFKQREIAETVLGHKHPAGVCVLISRFLNRYAVIPTYTYPSGDVRSDAFGQARRVFVKEALANYIAARSTTQ